MTELFNKAELKERRRSLRGQIPPCERILWARLRNRQVSGLKFRRQYGIDRFVVDFYCPDATLVVEIDGYSHTFEATWAYDVERQQYLESLGLSILRFNDDQIIKDIEAVLGQILVAAERRR